MAPTDSRDLHPCWVTDHIAYLGEPSRTFQVRDRCRYRQRLAVGSALAIRLLIVIERPRALSTFYAEKRNIQMDGDLGLVLAGLIRAAFESVEGDVEIQTGLAAERVGSSDLLVEVFVEAGSWFGEICLTVRSDGDAVDLALRAVDEMTAIPPSSWHLMLQPDCVEMQVRVAVPQLTDVLAAQVDEDENRPAHIVRSNALVDAVFVGRVVRAMCGHTFVPVETGPQARQREVCPRCVLVMEIATRVVELLDETAP